LNKRKKKRTSWRLRRGKKRKKRRGNTVVSKKKEQTKQTLFPQTPEDPLDQYAWLARTVNVTCGYPPIAKV
jgi:hypothetical protein